MTNASLIVNTRIRKIHQPKANGTVGKSSCVHTISADDIMISRSIPSQSSMGMTLKLKG